MVGETFYSILNVTKDASSSDIKKAYRVKIIKTHPDKLPPNKREWGTEETKILNEAYTVLKNSQTRTRYDRGEYDIKKIARVTPVSLGIGIIDDILIILISLNTSLPFKKIGNFTTSYDNQTSIYFPIYEGEDEKASINTKLGYFTIDEIPKMPKGRPKIYITFEIDFNGVLSVSAIEKSTNTSINITITDNKDWIHRVIR